MDLFVRASDYELISLSWSHSIYTFLQDLLGKKISKEEMIEWENKNIQEFKTPKGKTVYPSNRYSHIEKDYIVFETDDPKGIINEDIYVYYISLQPKLNIDLDTNLIMEEKLLLPTKNIPKLFLFKTVKLQETHITKDLAPYKWFIDVLDHFFRVNITDDNFKQDLLEFINTNQEAFNSIRRAFNTSQPKILGFGSDGIALDIGDKVLKIFTRNIAYEDAMEAWERLHKNPDLAKTEAMMYEVGEFKNTEKLTKTDVPLFYYIIEKMIPLQNVLKDQQEFDDFIADLTSKMLDDDMFESLKAKMFYPKMDRFIKVAVKYLAKKYAKDFEYYKHNLEFKEGTKLQNGWFEEFIEEVIMKHLTRTRTDLHLDNTGITPYGKLRFFDPTY